MSDNLPFEIQVEIMKKLPVKSLVQFRSVSKAWKSLIDSSDFIKHYSNKEQHLLVRYTHGSQPIYVSFVDDEMFPHQKVSLTLPVLVNMLQFHIIIDSSHGLLCLYGFDALGKCMAVLWNISIRKAVAVALPNLGYGIYGTALGFGVCPETTDHKIVKMIDITYWEDLESIPDGIPWQVEVFSLRTRAWRTPYSSNLPHTSIQFGRHQVVVDGLCYWLATDRSTIDPGFEAYNLIISFHMTNDEFREVNLPDSLVYYRSMDYLKICNLRESLVMLELKEQDSVFNVWLMEDGVSKQFTKLFTIDSPNGATFRILKFRKSGEPVIEILDNDGDPCYVSALLAGYEPKSKHITNLGISGTCSFHVYSYVETLLLLDQPSYIKQESGEPRAF